MATAAAKQSATGQIEISKLTLAQPYYGVNPLMSGSGNCADQPASAQLIPSPTSCAFLTHFSVTGAGATAAKAVAVTINGLMGGMTRVYGYAFTGDPNMSNYPLIMHFAPPLQGGGLGVPITITCPSSGPGGLVNAVNANGLCIDDVNGAGQYLMAVTIPTPEFKRERDEPPRESEILADAAKRLMREDVYVRARDGIRSHYLELLARASPLDADLITQLQSTIRAIDGLNDELLKFTHSAPRSPKRVVI